MDPAQKAADARVARADEAQCLVEGNIARLWRLILDSKTDKNMVRILFSEIIETFMHAETMTETTSSRIGGQTKCCSIMSRVILPGVKLMFTYFDWYCPIKSDRAEGLFDMMCIFESLTNREPFDLEVSFKRVAFEAYETRVRLTSDLVVHIDIVLKTSGVPRFILSYFKIAP